MRTDRGFLSIGEVLDTLKSDFPDVSVSKIRFLESEGLISPERTASGYRKFHGPDVERLRAILTMQRDSFLPLKVIRERLRALDAGTITADSLVAPAGAAPQPAAAPQMSMVPAAPPAPVVEEELAELPPVQLTEADLAQETGLEAQQIKSLKEFGVLCAHGDNGAVWYDGDDLTVGKIARSLLQLGFDVRHLRTLRRSAEQEADLFNQLVAPALRNRRPEVREQAVDTVSELARLARQLRQTYVRQSLRAALGDK